MKSIKLTPKEKEIFGALSATDGGVLFKHVKITGTVCYRLLDKNKNPLANYREGTVQSLIEKEVLQIDNGGYVTKATIETK